MIDYHNTSVYFYCRAISGQQREANRTAGNDATTVKKTSGLFSQVAQAAQSNLEFRKRKDDLENPSCQSSPSVPRKTTANVNAEVHYDDQDYSQIEKVRTETKIDLTEGQLLTKAQTSLNNEDQSELTLQTHDTDDQSGLTLQAIHAENEQWPEEDNYANVQNEINMEDADTLF